MLERATRLCSMSPQIATVRPSMPPLRAADGQRVEQRLGRVLVRAVAGIDHGAVDLLRQQLGGARRMVAHDQDVRLHGVERHRRVDQRLALLDRGGRDAMFMTSAPSRLPASSKELWVRVEASKNRLIWVRPHSDLRFGAPLQFSSAIVSARSSSELICGADSPSQESRCRCGSRAGSLVLLGSLKPCVYGQPRDAASPNLVFDAMGDMSTSRAIAVVALQRLCDETRRCRQFA